MPAKQAAQGRKSKPKKETSPKAKGKQGKTAGPRGRGAKPPKKKDPKVKGKQKKGKAPKGRSPKAKGKQKKSKKQPSKKKPKVKGKQKKGKGPKGKKPRVKGRTKKHKKKPKIKGKTKKHKKHKKKHKHGKHHGKKDEPEEPKDEPEEPKDEPEEPKDEPEEPHAPGKKPSVPAQRKKKGPEKGPKIKGKQRPKTPPGRKGPSRPAAKGPGAVAKGDGPRVTKQPAGAAAGGQKGDTETGQHTPKYKIKVGKVPKDMPARATERLVEIVVDQSIDMADQFTLVLRNDDFWVSDSEDFNPGSKVEIELGYEEHGAKMSKVMEGEVTALKADFPRRGSMNVRVIGATGYHRLMRGRQMRAWENKTYADIAKAIAGECKLKAVVDPTTGVQEYVFQRNQTNLEFLLEIAERVGYEVFVSEGKLFFRKPTADKTKVRTLKKGELLLSFNPRIHAALRPTGVKVISWDDEKVAQVTGEAKDTDAGPAMGGQELAPAVSAKIGPALEVVTEQVFRKPDQAKALAVGMMRQASLDLVQAEAACQGAPDLRPGFVVQVEGVGEVFSGPYYITRVLHDFLPAGFSTRLWLKKTSILLQPPAPPKPKEPEQPKQKPVKDYEITATVVDQETGRPMGNADYDVVDGSGSAVASGRTDWQGGLRHPVPAGNYTVKVRPPAAEGPASPGQPGSAAVAASGAGGDAAPAGGMFGGALSGLGGALTKALSGDTKGAISGLADVAKGVVPREYSGVVSGLGGALTKALSGDTKGAISGLADVAKSVVPSEYSGAVSGLGGALGSAVSGDSQGAMSGLTDAAKSVVPGQYGGLVSGAGGAVSKAVAGDGAGALSALGGAHSGGAPAGEKPSHGEESPHDEEPSKEPQHDEEPSREPEHDEEPPPERGESKASEKEDGQPEAES